MLNVMLGPGWDCEVVHPVPSTTSFSAASFRWKNILLPKTHRKVGLPSVSMIACLMLTVEKLRSSKLKMAQKTALEGSEFVSD